MGLTALSLSLLRGALDSRHIVIVSDPIDYPAPQWGDDHKGKADLSPAACKTAYFHLIGSVATLFANRARYRRFEEN